ncbi:MAG TPA: transcription antitermination factor NusB [Pseudomonadales bacterium]|nr:transcription antitermination factor NusB [Pseudomonadales bacterium]
MSETRFDPWARRRARRLVLQALYQWQMSGADEAEIERQFREDPNFERVDGQFFHELLRGVIECCGALDAQLAPLLDRKVLELDRVELALLRMGVYELRHRHDVPFKVAIDEAVGLARVFGAEESHRYINGVLDAVARSERAREVAADG